MVVVVVVVVVVLDRSRREERAGGSGYDKRALRSPPISLSLSLSAFLHRSNRPPTGISDPSSSMYIFRKVSLFRIGEKKEERERDVLEREILAEKSYRRVCC